MNSPHQAVIALGANIGNARGALLDAVQAITMLPGTQVVASSRIFRTAPVGGPDQPDYLNAITLITTELEPLELLAALQRIENEHGRERTVRWGPRTLDLDIIMFDDVRSDDPELTLPHPRAHERGFVLVPWRDADPQAMWIDGRGIDVMLADVEHGDCVAVSTEPVHGMVIQ
ncbi:MAG: 2-amino-4-hydroxy-6-hydroxymethyldihydropteridine pyrophosphokinae [Actinomycetota bacterium]|jgi:2-amino-4-hydroxy-6-hydroxymethyldihydropteridine diphosphokinase